MKNQYFGDIGDYGKYGLLRTLALNGISIAVNWYLTDNVSDTDGSSDGKFTQYLKDEKIENTVRKFLIFFITRLSINRNEMSAS